MKIIRIKLISLSNETTIKLRILLKHNLYKPSFHKIQWKEKEEKLLSKNNEAFNA